MEQETQVTSLISLTSSGLPAWIHIMPSGRFVADDGRGPFLLKKPEEVIKASIRPKVDMVVDRDHDLVLSENKNIPAAGWVKEIEYRDDGLWARVEWTATAIQQIKAKEYRYISPVFAHKKDGTITKILHISLVNNPALELTAVASRNLKSVNNNPKKEELKMDKEQMEALALSLGLEKDADADAIIAASKEISSQVEKAKADIASIRTACKLDDKAEVKDIIEVASSKIEKSKSKPDAAEYVPMEVFQETSAEVASLRKQLTDDKAETLVVEAMSAGKITPAQKAWAIEYASSDPKGFDTFLKNQVPVLNAGENTAASKKAGNPSGELTEAEITVCKQMGLTKEQFLGTSKEKK